MAVRSQIGSSLVAKSNPGSPIRKTTEDKVNNPSIPGKGETGSIQRQTIEQPFLKETPSGSARTVSVTPAIESQAIGNRNMPIPEAAGGANGQPQLRSGANGQALFQGGVSTPSAVRSAAPVAKGGTAAKSASVAGVNKGAIGGMGMITPQAASTSSEAAPSGSFWSGILPTAASLGARAAAADGKVTGGQPKNLSQAIVGTLGRGNAAAQAYATNPQITASGQGSISKGLQHALNNPVGTVKEQIASGTGAIRSVVNTIVSKLRSLLK